MGNLFVNKELQEELQKLEPIRTGGSLHIDEEVYEKDGKIYHLYFAIGDESGEASIEIEE